MAASLKKLKELLWRRTEMYFGRILVQKVFENSIYDIILKGKLYTTLNTQNKM
jgi:hypothetical protein